MTITRPRVVVAMSGGVDSSVAAALLVEQGCQVVGIMLRLWAEEGSGEGAENRCCSLEATDVARRVAHALDIPFYLINAEQPFKVQVVDYFVQEYLAGRTPNPCFQCNRHVRFGFLLRRALALGADHLATGHYARVRCVDGQHQLLKGIDPAKDQSYVLHLLGQAELAHVLFPVGQYSKEQVRALARERGLPVAERPESQELCFVADDYRSFLRRHSADGFRPGPILDTDGRVLGQHQGLPFYTVGQRQGLGLATGQPLYVLTLDGERNALVVGPASALGRRELTARQVHFVSGQAPTEPVVVTAKIRYRATEAPATLYPLAAGRIQLVFAQPQRATTPGQGVVFYQGEVVLGGGIIE